MPVKNRLLPAARSWRGIQRETILLPDGSTADCAMPVATRIAINRAAGTSAVARVPPDHASKAMVSTIRGPQRSTDGNLAQAITDHKRAQNPADLDVAQPVLALNAARGIAHAEAGDESKCSNDEKKENDSPAGGAARKLQWD